MGVDTLNDLLWSLDVWGLNIDRANAKLVVPQTVLVMRGHVVLYQVASAVNPAHKVGLVRAKIEIAMADLPIIIGPDRIISLAYVHGHVHIVWESLNRAIDRLDRSCDLRLACGREIRLIDLDVLASGLSKPAEILMQ